MCTWFSLLLRKLQYTLMYWNMLDFLKLAIMVYRKTHSIDTVSKCNNNLCTYLATLLSKCPKVVATILIDHVLNWCDGYRQNMHILMTERAGRMKNALMQMRMWIQTVKNQTANIIKQEPIEPLYFNHTKKSDTI